MDRLRRRLACRDPVGRARILDVDRDLSDGLASLQVAPVLDERLHRRIEPVGAVLASLDELVDGRSAAASIIGDRFHVLLDGRRLPVDVPGWELLEPDDENRKLRVERVMDVAVDDVPR